MLGGATSWSPPSPTSFIPSLLQLSADSQKTVQKDSWLIQTDVGWTFTASCQSLENTHIFAIHVCLSVNSAPQITCIGGKADFVDFLNYIPLSYPPCIVLLPQFIQETEAPLPLNSDSLHL